MIRLHSLATTALLLVVAAIPAGEPSAARAPASISATGDTIDAWRFNVGERMEYSMTWGVARIGQASLTVEAVDTIAGVPVYRAAMEMHGGPPFYRLDDRQVTWIRPAPFASLRFDQKLRQGGYRRDRSYRMDADSGTYSRYDQEDGEFVLHDTEASVAIPDGALDDVSFLYFMRLAQLEMGQRYQYNRFFLAKGNPIDVEVLRRERIRVPAGRFETVVLRPIFKTGGLFGEGAEAEMYVTDDERRIVVRLKMKAPIGTLNLYLKEYEAGAAAPGIAAPPG